MKITTNTIEIKTKRSGDLIDITDKIRHILQGSGLKSGNLTVFVIGSTAAITTFEYERGLIKDMQEFYEKIASFDRHYHHDETWGDANGASHVRSAMQGPSLTIPFEKGELMLGTWQQVVLAEFDTRPRERRVVVQIIGE